MSFLLVSCNSERKVLDVADGVGVIFERFDALDVASDNHFAHVLSLRRTSVQGDTRE